MDFYTWTIVIAGIHSALCYLLIGYAFSRRRKHYFTDALTFLFAPIALPFFVVRHVLRGCDGEQKFMLALASGALLVIVAIAAVWSVEF